MISFKNKRIFWIYKNNRDAYNVLFFADVYNVVSLINSFSYLKCLKHSFFKQSKMNYITKLKGLQHKLCLGKRKLQRYNII